MNSHEKKIFRVLGTSMILLLASHSCAALSTPVASNADSCLNPGSGFATIHINLDEDTGFPTFADRVDCSSGIIHPHNGSICLDAGKRPDMKFILTESVASQWEFDDMELSGDGLTWPGTLPMGAYSDFEFDSQVGLDTGRPYVAVQGATISVPNNNCLAFEVYYRLTLKKKGTSLKIQLHPLIENRGTNP